MRPIAQTFTVNETDVEGIYLSAVSLYFAKKHPSLGVTIQIRATDNGAPAPQIMEFSQVHANSSDVNTSTNATAVTKFSFESLVYLRNGTYALVIIPDGGNDLYEAWVSKLSEKDVTTQAPIIKNNETGSFFLSGNDITWTPVIDEDLKFDLHRANFTATSGTVEFSKRNIEFLKLRSWPAGMNRLYKDTVFCGIDDKISILSIDSVIGTFQNNEIVYQYSGSDVVAKGLTYFADSSTLKLNTVEGAFTNFGDIQGVTSNATAQIVSLSQDVVVSNTSATVSVPDASLYSANDWVYVVDTSTNLAEIMIINTVDTVLNTVTFLDIPKADDTNAIMGKIRGGSGLGTNTAPNTASYPLSAKWAGMSRESLGYDIAILTMSNANTTVNFSDSNGQRLIGIGSGMNAVIDKCLDLTYDMAHFLFNDLTPRSTDILYSFKGFADDGSYTEDVDAIAVQNDINKEFNDTSRIMLSRSHEITNLPVGREGDYSMRVFGSMISTDSKISPAIDLRATQSTYVRNFTAKVNQLRGVYLTVEPTQLQTTDNIPLIQFNRFAKNKTVRQVSNNSINGVVFEANSTNITVINGSNMSDFQIGQVVENAANTDQRATILAVEPFNEFLGNGITLFSRYVSKRVTLAEGLDSEDIKVFLTAYRPIDTDFKVYCKLLNSEDSRSFNSKLWTPMVPVHSGGLRSDLVNKEDFVELEYRLPESVLLHSSDVVANSTSTTITCPSTAEIGVGDEVYIYDTNLGLFNLRRVVSVDSTTSFTVIQAPSGNFGFSNTHIGVVENIPSKQCAFRFTEGNGIARYTNEKDKVFETYKSFAIKIVPISKSSHIVPRLRDMRALALQL